MNKVTIHVAKTNLSKLIAKVEAGEEVVICRGNKEVARLVPAGVEEIRPARGSPKSAPSVAEESAAWDGKSVRTPGLLKGKMVIADSFYDPWSSKDFGPGIMDDDPEWGSPGVWDGKTPRKPGSLKGQITLDDSFFDPLSDEELGLVNDDPAKSKP